MYTTQDNLPTVMSISKNERVRVNQLKPKEQYLEEIRHHLSQTLLSFSFIFCQGSDGEGNK